VWAGTRRLAAARGPFAFALGERQVGPHEQGLVGDLADRVLVGYGEAEEAVCFLVVSGCDGEGFCVPGQFVAHPKDAAVEDAACAQAGEVGVAAVVSPQFADSDVAFLPDAGQPVIEVVSDAAGALHGAQQVGLAKLVAGPFRELVLGTVGPKHVQGDRAVGLDGAAAGDCRGQR
jgi:hypothetical protein